MTLFPNLHTETIDFGGRKLTLETGRMAKQAAGAVLVTYGETMVLVTVTTTYAPRKGLDFFPLVVDFVEKTYAAGKLPGGFFKREARPSDQATLSARQIDRPIRPLFPDGFKNEVQVIATVLSVDGETDPGFLGIIGASAALHISDIPWNGPIAGTFVGRLDGKLVVAPSLAQMKESDLELFVAAKKDGIVMVEGSSLEVSEDDAVGAMQFAVEQMQPILDLIERFRTKVGKTKHAWVAPKKDEALVAKVKELAFAKIKEAAFIKGKHERYAAYAAVKDEVIAALGEDGPSKADDVKELIEDLKYSAVRHAIVEEGRRIDGRKSNQIRPIECQVGILPRTHGSALFTRGETQALVAVTFGTKKDEQRIDALTGEYTSRFMLHYNFPPFSTGEVKPSRSPGRREIGHGNLAHRGVTPVLPAPEDFPYTIRVVSEVLESNGSSSMATVCGSSLALMQAGVPVKAPVAGIAMGLIAENGKFAVLSDILGDEDHLGDMDFKVVGTKAGITAVQMDIKVESLTWDVMRQALHQAKEGRLHILGEMDKSIHEPADDLSPHAPRIFTVIIDTEKIRDVIGPGGKHIRAIVAETGCDIDINDDGRVDVAAVNGEAAARAIELIRSYTSEPEVGKIYLGTVTKTVDFGAFVAIMPGTEGLCHISELAEGRVRQTEDVVKEGDKVMVKVLGIDRQGKIKLSRRAALEEQGATAAAPVEA
ncbi:MAG: polyribonucleotide nucleotidyltransferase [Deltaproteobacteria bacterium]|nr:polyribonucleotide nucleotidyltransferase [Deltaproteobacteria bacterium]